MVESYNTTTEAEAVKKICPVSSSPEGGVSCRGSRCMLWRWADGPTEYLENVLTADKALKREGWEFHSGGSAGNGYGTMKRPWGDRRPGKCGLAKG